MVFLSEDLEDDAHAKSGESILKWGLLCIWVWPRTFKMKEEVISKVKCYLSRDCICGIFLGKRDILVIGEGGVWTGLTFRLCILPAYVTSASMFSSVKWPSGYLPTCQVIPTAPVGCPALSVSSKGGNSGYFSDSDCNDNKIEYIITVTYYYFSWRIWLSFYPDQVPGMLMWLLQMLCKFEFLAFRHFR